jgi:phosphoglucomutase/phosphopentomutase
MVTASHNPKQDNGYKLYWANGAQIISPHDAQIARRILDDLAPWAGAGYDDPERVVYGHALLEDPTEDVPRAYFRQLRGSLCRFPEENRESALPIVYTAMHGVGHAFTSRSFEAFGLPAYVPTKEQLLPDPEFPTVAFPNPEEGKGALQLAMATAEAHGARLVLANDPDADRLAVAEMDPVTRRWKIFTGNEIGTLLGVWELEQHLRLHPDANRADLYFVASTVSSKALKAVAKAEGLRFEETLTGFKWMGNKTDELRNRDGKTVLLSFEEAIGFCIGDLVKDKDGVCAAAVVAEMAIWLDRHVNGQTLTQRLEELCTRYGHFVTRNGYIKVYDPATVAAIFERLRNGGQYWDACGEYAIESVRDLTTGFDSAQPGNKAVLPVSKSTQMITYTFANGCVATLRTSGTEPKLKFYVELAGRAGQPKADVEREADKQVREIVDRMLEPEKHGLAPPTL